MLFPREYLRKPRNFSVYSAFGANTENGFFRIFDLTIGRDFVQTSLFIDGFVKVVWGTIPTVNTNIIFPRVFICIKLCRQLYFALCIRDFNLCAQGKVYPKIPKSSKAVMASETVCLTSRFPLRVRRCEIFFFHTRIPNVTNFQTLLQPCVAPIEFPQSFRPCMVLENMVGFPWHFTSEKST
jgi:hypothetical protein